jgi:hypothetical protein
MTGIKAQSGHCPLQVASRELSGRRLRLERVRTGDPVKANNQALETVNKMAKQH